MESVSFDSKLHYGHCHTSQSNWPQLDWFWLFTTVASLSRWWSKRRLLTDQKFNKLAPLLKSIGISNSLFVSIYVRRQIFRRWNRISMTHCLRGSETMTWSLFVVDFIIAHLLRPRRVSLAKKAQTLRQRVTWQILSLSRSSLCDFVFAHHHKWAH